MSATLLVWWILLFAEDERGANLIIVRMLRDRDVLGAGLALFVIAVSHGALLHGFVQTALFMPSYVQCRSMFGIVHEFDYLDVDAEPDERGRYVDLRVPSEKRVVRVWAVQADPSRVTELVRSAHAGRPPNARPRRTGTR